LFNAVIHHAGTSNLTDDATAVLIHPISSAQRKPRRAG